MVMSSKKRFLLMLCITFLGLFWRGNVSVYATEEYTVYYENESITTNCYMNEADQVLLPLEHVTNLLGYSVEVCGRCGKDEVYSSTKEGEKGRLYVNWYQDILTYSNDPTIIILDAITERVDGITYTSYELYNYFDHTVRIDSINKEIIITKGKSNTLTNTDTQSSTLGGLSSNELTLAYDPNCISCKDIIQLLDTIGEERKIQIHKIDITKDNIDSLEYLYSNSNVPEKLQHSFPIVYIGTEYLYASEINEENLLHVLSGNVYTHNIEYSTASVPSYKEVEEINPSNKKILVYFYSTTCASCTKSVEYIYKLNNTYEDLEIIGYNIYEVESLYLLKAYGRAYNIDTNQLGDIPAVFISNVGLVGDEDILEKLNDLILLYESDNPTKLIDKDTIIKEDIIISGLAVFGAGLINGFNPCSLSMFLFLLSIIMVDRTKLLKISLSFIVGKFIMFFLLGTILYKSMGFIHPNIISKITKIGLLLFILTFVILNINDYIMAKQEKLDKMILQLPSRLKKLNHTIIKNAMKHVSSNYILLIMLLLGMILAFGEFMCSGQLYLTSIVVLIQSSPAKWISKLYLAIYSFAFIVPLLLLTLFVYYGKKVFHLSESILNRLPLIKLISSLLFLLLGLYVAFLL